ncbi:MAG: signal recognition particle receptor subunit alpha, partial [Microthrixaceae bacterium]
MELVAIVLIVLVVVAGIAFVAVGRSRGGAPGEIGPEPPGAGGTATIEAPTADTPAEAPTASDSVPVLDEVDLAETEIDEAEVAEVEELVRPSFRERLAKARSTFSGYVGSVLSRSEIDDESWEELEEALILADVGIGPTQELLDTVKATVKERKLTTNDELIEALRDEMKLRLVASTELVRSEESPTIWLFVGVNGVGKTTTIGK